MTNICLKRWIISKMLSDNSCRKKINLRQPPKGWRGQACRLHMVHSKEWRISEYGKNKLGIGDGRLLFQQRVHGKVSAPIGKYEYKRAERTVVLAGRKQYKVACDKSGRRVLYHTESGYAERVSGGGLNEQFNSKDKTE